MAPRLKWDPENSQVSYGLWECPACGSQFYAGGRALHNQGCPDTGYDKCVFLVGDKVLQTAVEWASRNGEDDPAPLLPFTMADLRQQLPQLVPS